MGKRISLVAALGVVVLAFGALSATANAATWFLAGAELKVPAKMAEATTEVNKYELNGGGLNVECTGLKLIEGLIEPIVRMSFQKWTLTNCTTKNANCSVPKSISTEFIKANVNTLGKPEVEVKIEPKNESETFAIIPFEGEKCAVAGNKSLKGKKMTSQLQEGQEEKLEHDWIVNSTGELKLAGAAATFKGSSLVKLAPPGAPSWSFH